MTLPLSFLWLAEQINLRLMLVLAALSILSIRMVVQLVELSGKSSYEDLSSVCNQLNFLHFGVVLPRFVSLPALWTCIGYFRLLNSCLISGLDVGDCKGSVRAWICVAGRGPPLLVGGFRRLISTDSDPDTNLFLRLSGMFSFSHVLPKGSECQDSRLFSPVTSYVDLCENERISHLYSGFCCGPIFTCRCHIPWGDYVARRSNDRE